MSDAEFVLMNVPGRSVRLRWSRSQGVLVVAGDNSCEYAVFLETDQLKAWLLRHDSDHVHNYVWQPSGRGVGFDQECDCGAIRNSTPIS